MLSPHKVVEIFQQKEVQKMLSFLYKDVLVGFHKKHQSASQKATCELLSQEISTSSVSKKTELNQKSYSHLRLQLQYHGIVQEH